MGAIQRLGKDHYRVSIEGPRVDGKRTRRTKVVRGPREAAEVELARMKLDMGKEADDFDSWTLSAYWDAVYAPTLQQKGKDTRRGIEGVYKRHVKPLFGDVKMSDVTKRMVESKLSTVENDHARWAAFKALRQAFNYGWESELLSDNPFLRKPRVKPPRKVEQEVMDAESLAEWMDGMRGYRYEAAMLLMVACGLRREEACALKWEDVTFSDGLAFAKVDKTSKDDGLDVTKTERSTRTVVCAGYVAARLEELSGEGWICQSVNERKQGEMVKPHWVYASYKKWCAERGVRYIPPRNLRTTYATLQQANEVDALVVSRALGHTKLSTDYDHYFMANKPAQVAAARALSESLGGVA